MTTIVGSRRDNDGNTTAFYDQTTQETLIRMLPAWIDEDFIGGGHTAGVPAVGSPTLGYPWMKKIVGAAPPTCAIVANAATGVMQLALTATSEAEDCAIYFGDQLNFDVSKGGIFETRLAYSVLPASGVESVFGLQSAWVSGPDNVAYYMQFQLNGSGLVNMRTKDGVNTLAGSTGQTLATGAYHIFRIDATDVTNVVFSIDGVNYSTPSQFSFAAAPPNSVLQPYLSLYRATGTGLGTMLIDTIQAASNRV